MEQKDSIGLDFALALVRREIELYDAFQRELKSSNSAKQSLAERLKLMEGKVRRYERDELTRLVTRKAGIDQANKRITQFLPEHAPFSVAFIDCNNLKIINDRFTHKAGDHYLKSVAAALRAYMPRKSIIIRWGGDEFVVLTQVSADGLDALMQSVQHELSRRGRSRPYSISYGTVQMGIRENFNQAVERSDKLMYSHKLHMKSGRQVE